MWNMCIIAGLHLSSWLRLYFKDRGGLVCKEPTPPSLPSIFSALFPSISLTFTKREYMVLPFSPLNLSEINRHILALCLEENPNTKKRFRCLFPVIIDESCILGDKKQRRCKGCFIRKNQQEQVSWGLPPSVAIAEKADLDKPCAQVRASSKPEHYWWESILPSRDSQR